MGTKSAILFKSPQDSDEYSTLFAQNAIEVHYIPVLEFSFVNTEELRDDLLDNRARFSGLIITSQRAVEAIEKAVGKGPDGIAQLEHWKEMPVYVVGEVTGRKVKEFGWEARGHSSGNGDALADYIIDDRKEMFSFGNLPLLNPCGNLRNETLPMKLKKANIPVKSICVYVTKKRDGLDSALIEFNKQKKIPRILIFFSPSGVNYVIPILQSLGLDLNNYKLIAIGPSTADRIKSMGLSPFMVASTPTPLGIFNCVSEALKS